MKPSLRLDMHRTAARQLIGSYRVRNPRVFGSVLYGTDTESSDLDILVDATGETTLFDIGAIGDALSRLLGVPVDVLTPDSLPEKVRARVLAEAQPL
jgi:uncharacterized protein